MTIIEKHQAERDSRAPFILGYLKSKGFVDANDQRTISVKEMYAHVRNNDPYIGGTDSCPLIYITRADLEYVIKKYGIGGRKAGRKPVSKAPTTKQESVQPARVESVVEDIDPESSESVVADCTEEEDSVADEKVVVSARKPVNRAAIDACKARWGLASKKVASSSKPTTPPKEMKSFEPRAITVKDGTMSFEDFKKDSRVSWMEDYELPMAYENYCLNPTAYFG